MLEFLIELDKSLFILINKWLANPVTDAIMPFITNDNGLRVVFGVILILLLWFGDKKLRVLALFCGLTLLATDQLTANFLKHLIERARPCHTFDEINLLVDCGAGFSMPSAHAANTFGQAILVGAQVKWARWPLLTYAFLVAISRIFVGMHYPADIIFGAIVGILIALILTFLFNKFDRAVLSAPAKAAVEDEVAEKASEHEVQESESQIDPAAEDA